MNAHEWEEHIQDEAAQAAIDGRRVARFVTTREILDALLLVDGRECATVYTFQGAVPVFVGERVATELEPLS